MEKKSLLTRYESLQEAELSAEDRRLVELAKAATRTSFSPYSHFSVGAAVRMEGGELFSGSNQENASFTTGLCAERTTVFYATAQHPSAAIAALAIAARGADGTFTEAPVTPCGACRQVLSEIEHRHGRPFRVLLYGTREILAFSSMSALLPFQFNADAL